MSDGTQDLGSQIRDKQMIVTAKGVCGRDHNITVEAAIDMRCLRRKTVRKGDSEMMRAPLLPQKGQRERF